jgi:hypothetical protein
MKTTSIEYNPQEHGFYEELLRLVITLSAVGIAFQLHDSSKVMPYAADQPMVLEGKATISGLEIHFFPCQIYTALLKPMGKTLNSFKVLKKQINPSPPIHPIQLNNVQLMMARLVGDAFVSYYERHLEAVEACWGREFEGKWHCVWHFAWAIRNAISHNGKIRFKKAKHPAVHWRNLKYDFNDNGRTVLFDDLTGVELILLMEEMDAELRRSQSEKKDPAIPQV